MQKQFLSEKYWGNKSVCVTGGSGFLGSFVVEQLQKIGAKNINVPRKRDYNLVELEAVKQLLSDKQPDMVIHLAASVGGIGANLLHQAEFFYENLLMGVQLLHESWKHDVKKFVAIGTVCAYPKFAPIPFKEEDLWNGYPEETNAPYGLAKKMMLVQSQIYRSQYNFNSVFLLPVNLYGPRDNFDLETSHVIPALIRKCVEARENNVPYITAWGDGSPTREFLYVEDAAEGIILAAEQLNSSEPVNLGSHYEISIQELVETIAELTNYAGDILWDTSKPNGQPRRKLDVTKAKNLFGFEAKTTFREGLKTTIEWFEKSQTIMKPSTWLEK